MTRKTIFIKTKDEFKYHLNSDAVNFYVDFCADDFTKKFGHLSNMNVYLNRHLYRQGFDLNSIKKMAKKINAKKKNLFVSVNSNCLTQEQMNYIIDNYYPVFKKNFVKGLILSEKSLIKAALECGFEVVLSFLVGIYNFDILNSYLNLGVKKIQLPSDLLLDDLLKIENFSSEINFEFLVDNSYKYSLPYLCSQQPDFYEENIVNKYEKIFLKEQDFKSIDLFNFNDNAYNFMFSYYSNFFCDSLINKAKSSNISFCM